MQSHAASIRGRIPFTGRWIRLATSRYSQISARSTDSDVVVNIESAREWLATFNSDTLPKNIYQLSYSRASGPGGQNVNKVNSKATLKISLDTLLSHVPSLLHPQIRASRYCHIASDAIIIQADEHRKQGDNANSCLVKLHNMIREAGSTAVPGETTPAQHERVKGLKKSANEHRLKEKKLRAKKKGARQGSGGSSE